MKDYCTAMVTRVISEPGDGTLYDYLIYRDGPDEFTFAPCRSTFRYPQRMNYWDVKDITCIADIPHDFEEGVNRYTIMECVRTMKELHAQ